MELTPEILARYLEVLEDANVDEFSCALFSFRRAVHVVKKDDDDSDLKKAFARKEAEKFSGPVRGNYANRGLYGGDDPPDFPRKANHSGRSPFEAE